VRYCQRAVAGRRQLPSVHPRAQPLLQPSQLKTATFCRQQRQQSNTGSRETGASRRRSRCGEHPSAVTGASETGVAARPLLWWPATSPLGKRWPRPQSWSDMGGAGWSGGLARAQIGSRHRSLIMKGARFNTATRLLPAVLCRCPAQRHPPLVWSPPPSRWAPA
jgi:hypothetical protein